MSIRLKLTIMFLAIALIPLLLVSALTFNNYKKSLKANRLARLEDLISFKADKIETYFAGLEACLELLQDSSIIRKNISILIKLADSPAAPEFVRAKKTVDDAMRNTAIIFGISDIMLLNAGGRVIYSLNPAHSQITFSKPLPGPGQKAFAKGKDGLYFSDIYFDDNKPAMLVSAPAFDVNNIPAGVIAMEVDMAPVYKLIQDVTGMGSTGETLIGKKDSDHVLYLNPLRHDPDAALKRRVTIGGIAGIAIQKAAEGQRGAGLTIDYRGKKVVAAWRYIPSLDWGLVAKIDAHEAFADVINLRNLIFMILGIIFVLAGIMAVSIAQSISGPIKRVAEGAEIIGSGNLDYKIGTDLKDEIGQLAGTFDKMAQDLKNLGIARETERKRLYGVLETLPVYVVLLSEDYHVPFANRFFRERFGASHGRRCYEYLFKRSEPCENCETYKVLKTGKPHHWEWTGPDNRNYDIYDFPFSDTDGSSMILEMGIDITEQKRAQESLRSASLYTRSLIEVSLDPLVTISSEGKITDVNEATIKATGVQRERLIGTDFSDYFTEPGKAREGYLQVFARGFVTDYPLTIRHKDGRLTDVLYNATVYKDTRGSVLGVFAAARDVTVLKQAEAELKRHRDSLEVLVNERTKNLRESEQRLNRSQEMAHLGSWELDVVNNRLIWSDEVYRIFGRTPQEFGATYEAFLEAVHPNDRAAVDAAYSGSLREKKDRYEIEHRVVRKSDDEVRIVHEKCEHIRDETGRIARSVGMVHDITERKRAEEELRRSNENLEQFAYVASHDLQEPLRIMANYSQLLEKRYKKKLDKDADDFIGFIVDAAKRMQKLIIDLLEYSRAGRKDIPAVDVNCNEILQKVTATMSAIIESEHAAVTHDNLPVVAANETALIQLFQNLIGNALKFRGNEPPLIHVAVRHDKNEWVFSVRDNGIGIEPQYKERIFQIFQRLHSRGEYPGTGIGLAICKKIVDNLGGRIWVESEAGKGSTFYFTMPT